MLDTERASLESENRKPRATLEEALSESAGTGLVFKPDVSRIPEEIEGHLFGLDEATKEKLKHFEGGSRLLGHLFRLLSPERSETEHAFANVMLDHYQALFDERKDLMNDEDTLQEKFKGQSQIEDFDDYAMAFDALHRVPEGDSTDTALWWTFSPYLAEAMSKRGIDEKTALERLMAWGLPAAEKAGEEANAIHLPGLDFLTGEDGQAKPYILSSNPEGASHVFTREKAEELVKGHVV